MRSDNLEVGGKRCPEPDLLKTVARNTGVLRVEGRCVTEAVVLKDSGPYTDGRVGGELTEGQKDRRV